ncbi:MAG: LEA type 2 family protein [Byssovorax sp.]
MKPKVPFTALAFTAAVFAAACVRPDPPKLTPVSATLVSISPTSMDVSVELDAENPNSIDLSARSVSAKLTLDGRIDAGSVNVAVPIKLPARKTTRFSAPLSVKWRELTSVAMLVAQNRPVPYEVDGTVEVGGESLNVDLPFKIKGTVTHEQLVKAALGSLPKIPGLPGIPALPTQR